MCGNIVQSHSLAILESFSLNHTLPYSVIAVQEANLATRWNPLYWQCACLCVNAGNYVRDIDPEAEEEEKEEEEGTKDRKVAPNYGKIAKAISDSQLAGVKIELPDINSAQVDFVPDIKNNSIFYSLQAITVVSDDLLERILTNRPYSSLSDFVKKVSPTTGQMLGLIKAGCFDEMYHMGRAALLDKYLHHLAQENFPLKDKLTSVQLKKALELKMDFTGFEMPVRFYHYKKYLDAHQTDKVNKRYVLTEEATKKFFHSFIEKSLNLSKGEYGNLPDGNIYIKLSAFKKVYDESTEALMGYFNSEEGRCRFQQVVQDNYIAELKEKYCRGTLSTWEMETMCFYYSGHELQGVNNAQYNIKDFNLLPEDPGDSKDVCALAGTITNVNNSKHIVSLLTTTGVVDIKFSATIFTKFNQKISEIDPKTNKKIVIDDTWFKRGNKILVYGQRRENMFYCRGSYAPGQFPKHVGLIETIGADGSLNLRYSRKTK